jgi:predicted Zn-dependent peptidase
MGILDGRTGRLWRALVDEKKLALSAGAGYWGLRHGGMISVTAQPREGVKLEDLEAAMAQVVDALAAEGPTEAELRKSKNQLIANTVRSLQTNSGIAHALGSADVINDWRDVIGSLKLAEGTTAEDVKRLIGRYCAAGGRNVLTVKRLEKKQ